MTRVVQMPIDTGVHLRNAEGSSDSQSE